MNNGKGYILCHIRKAVDEHIDKLLISPKRTQSELNSEHHFDKQPNEEKKALYLELCSTPEVGAMIKQENEIINLYSTAWKLLEEIRNHKGTYVELYEKVSVIAQQ